MKFSAGAQKTVYCQVSEMQMICAKTLSKTQQNTEKQDINTTFKAHVFLDDCKRDTKSSPRGLLHQIV